MIDSVMTSGGLFGGRRPTPQASGPARLAARRSAYWSAVAGRLRAPAAVDVEHLADDHAAGFESVTIGGGLFGGTAPVATIARPSRIRIPATPRATPQAPSRLPALAPPGTDYRLALGYASVNRCPYVGPGGGLEMIARGAFERFLSMGPNIFALLNHQLVVASTAMNTLLLTEDPVGLLAAVWLDPSTEAGMETIRGVLSGKLAGMSILRNGINVDRHKDLTVYRTAEAPEVSFVERGANPAALAIIPGMASPDHVWPVPGRPLTEQQAFCRQFAHEELCRLAASLDCLR